MSDLPNWAWFCAAVVGSIGCLCLLRLMSHQVRHEVELHNLRQRVYEVRIKYLKQMIRTLEPDEEQPLGEVEIIEDEADEMRQAA